MKKYEKIWKNIPVCGNQGIWRSLLYRNSAQTTKLTTNTCKHLQYPGLFVPPLHSSVQLSTAHTEKDKKKAVFMAPRVTALGMPTSIYKMILELPHHTVLFCGHSQNTTTTSHTKKNTSISHHVCTPTHPYDTMHTHPHPHTHPPTPSTHTTHPYHTMLAHPPYTHTHTHIRTHVPTHTHTHTRTHTHTHKRTHIHTNLVASSRTQF